MCAFLPSGSAGVAPHYLGPPSPVKDWRGVGPVLGNTPGAEFPSFAGPAGLWWDWGEGAGAGGGPGHGQCFSEPQQRRNSIYMLQLTSMHCDSEVQYFLSTELRAFCAFLHFISAMTLGGRHGLLSPLKWGGGGKARLREVKELAQGGSASK